MSIPANHAPLNVTQKAEHRVFVGLSWDPNDNPSLFQKLGALLGKKPTHHDLDLSCYYYDENKNCLGYVTAEPEHYTDSSGAIYHSGDNIEGVGDGDDEQISVNLKSLPHNIHHLIFKASIHSGHVFGDVADPAIRVCDGYTEHCFASAEIDGGLALESDSFIFTRIYRHDGAWAFHALEDFRVLSSVENWEDALKGYLD